MPGNPPINKPDSSRDLIIFMISSISSFKIINVIIPEPKIFFWIAASVADAAAVNANGIKTLSANGQSTFFIKGKPGFSNGPKTPPDCPILCNWVFDNFILADELFAKAFWSLKTCVLVNNNLCGKLYSSLELPIAFDERFKVPSVPFFTPDFNLLNCELEKFMFKGLYWVVLQSYFILILY